MKQRNTPSPQQGMSLIEVMITTGIISIVTLTFATMMSQQNREIAAVHQQLASIDLQNLLQSTLADGSVCTYILTQPTPRTFDATNATPNSPNPPSFVLPLTSLPMQGEVGAPAIVTAGALASPLSSSLKVRTQNPFSITNIRGTGNFFRADLQVAYDNAKLVRAIRPATVSLTIKTTNVGATHTIKSCRNSKTVPIGGCTQYWTSGNFVPLGNRHCWGEVTENGNSFVCNNGSTPVQVSSSEDAIGMGETTSNGTNLFTECKPPLGQTSPILCHVSTYYCF